METQVKKCSSNKHSEIDAISYCQECKRSFCNKCQNLHSELFEEHKIINLNIDLNEIFIDLCKQKNHNYKYEFFCKTHNTLCCSICISKIKDEYHGQHSDCDVCFIKDIKNSKKNKLRENIKNLEDLSHKFEKSFNELKKILEKVNEEKEELKLKIQKNFTKIRNSLNEKEDKLLLEIDEAYNNLYFKEDIIKEGEKLPKKIKISLEKGKLVDKEWNDDNLNSLINDCVNIENNIQDINKINENIKKCNLNKKIKIIYNIEDEQINGLINSINNFGKIIIDYDLYDDFNIELRNPTHILKNHTSGIYSLAVMKDGRLVSASLDKSIIIYNKITYQPDLIIKEHNSWLCNIIQLSSGELTSCSDDKTIKLFKIKGNSYEVLQTLNYHKGRVSRIIELSNKTLVSSSLDSSIIFYIKYNNKYKMDYQFSTHCPCYTIMQTKENEICYSEVKNNKFCFFDLLERKIKTSLVNISVYDGVRSQLILINKELLIAPGYGKLYMVNINRYQIVRVIETPDSDWVFGICKINKNILLTGDSNKTIKQWIIEKNNLVLTFKKENAHSSDINTLLKIGNGHIASCSDDHSIKIW